MILNVLVEAYYEGCKKEYEYSSFLQHTTTKKCLIKTSTEYT